MPVKAGIKYRRADAEKPFGTRIHTTRLRRITTKLRFDRVTSCVLECRRYPGKLRCLTSWHAAASASHAKFKQLRTDAISRCDSTAAFYDMTYKRQRRRMSQLAAIDFSFRFKIPISAMKRVTVSVILR